MRNILIGFIFVFSLSGCALPLLGVASIAGNLLAVGAIDKVVSNSYCGDIEEKWKHGALSKDEYHQMRVKADCGLKGHKDSSVSASASK